MDTYKYFVACQLLIVIFTCTKQSPPSYSFVLVIRKRKKLCSLLWNSKNFPQPPKKKNINNNISITLLNNPIFVSISISLENKKNYNNVFVSTINISKLRKFFLSKKKKNTDVGTTWGENELQVLYLPDPND